MHVATNLAFIRTEDNALSLVPVSATIINISPVDCAAEACHPSRTSVNRCKLAVLTRQWQLSKSPYLFRRVVSTRPNLHPQVRWPQASQPFFARSLSSQPKNIPTSFAIWPGTALVCRNMGRMPFASLAVAMIHSILPLSSP